MAGEPVPRAVFEAQARGARVLFMVMGLHQPRDYYKFFANHTVFTISEGLSRMVGALALQPLWRPLQRSIYDAAAAWRALRPEERREKKDQVLFDRDTAIPRDVVKLLRTPDARDRLLALGAEPIGDTPEQFGAFMRAESRKWARVIGEGCERGALRVARGEGGGRREHAGWLGSGPRAWSGGRTRERRARPFFW
jgi:hypothetical protein